MLRISLSIEFASACKCSPKYPRPNMATDPYRSSEWAQFRAEVIRLDGGMCRRCGGGGKDGAVLQVHHKEYIRGHKPWEYPYELCETVCRGCHASEHKRIAPRFGWEYVTDDDAGDMDRTCDYCGTSIRYSFIIQHPNWPTMEVGEVCCDNLTSTQFASTIAESRRRYADRLRRFVDSPRWRAFNNGVQRIKQLGFDIEVVPIDGGFRLRIKEVLGKTTFPKAFDAKVKVFELIEAGEIEKYFAKARQPLLRKQEDGRARI